MGEAGLERDVQSSVVNMLRLRFLRHPRGDTRQAGQETSLSSEVRTSSKGWY